MRTPGTVILLMALAGLFLGVGQAQQPAFLIDAYAGSNDVGDGGPAAAAQLGLVEGIAVDRDGNLYIADSLAHRIRRVSAAGGEITTVAGDGVAGFLGDGGPAAEARLDTPYGVAVGGDGSIYIADFGNARVRKVGRDGVIETVAGGGNQFPHNRQALSVRLAGPRNVAADGAGNLYISDFTGHRVFRVSSSGEIVVLAGNGAAGYDGDGAATNRKLNAPAGLAVTPDGALYVADSGNNLVRRVHGGLLTTAAGGEAGGVELVQPLGLALDGQGGVYIADSGSGRIVWRSPGGHTMMIGASFQSGGGVRDVAAGSRLYVGGGRRVWAVDANGGAGLVAGDGSWGRTGDGVKAAAASLNGPIGLGFDQYGRLLIAEEGAGRVRTVGASGAIFTLAGGGTADIADPVAVESDAWGRVWIADYLGNVIHRVNFERRISTAAGDGEPGFGGDGGWAYSARLHGPRGLAADAFGGMYVADSGNHRIRYIDPDGRISTVAGSGARGYGGDLGPALLAQLDTPSALAAAGDGSLFVADTGNNVVRKIRPDGVILTVAGLGVEAQLNRPAGLAIGEAGALFVADTGNHRIRVRSPDGEVWTAAGTGHAGYGGDGGPATEARLTFPAGVAAAPDGTVYIADLGNNRVRRLDPIAVSPDTEPPGDCAVLHAATFAGGAVAPGQIASIFGQDIGPVEAAAASAGGSGVIGTSLGGVEVRFGADAAPLFFVSAGQINVQVPYSVAGKRTVPVEVYLDGVPRARGEVGVAEAVPGLFTLEAGEGPVVALNRDGTLNSAANPAVRGDAVVLFATGEGMGKIPIEAGALAADPLPAPLLPVSVWIGGMPADVLYAGAAPGYAGLMQINVRLRGGFSPSGILPVELRVGGAVSQSGVTIAVK